MQGKTERYVVGGSPLNLNVGAAAAYLSVPPGHIDNARKVVDLLSHTLRERNVGFSVKQGEDTVQFIFGEIKSGRLYGKEALDGDSFRGALSQLQDTLPDSAALNAAHEQIRSSWVGKTDLAAAVAPIRNIG